MSGILVCPAFSLPERSHLDFSVLVLGQGNKLKSGTAQLMLCLFENPAYAPNHFKVALDPKPLEEARAQNLRQHLNVGTLSKRIPKDNMKSEWSVQTLAMLADEVGGTLRPVSKWAEQQFAKDGPRAKRRQDARKTEFQCAQLVLYLLYAVLISR